MRGFTWGDTVRVNAAAAEASRPGELGEIVGIREVETEAQARQFESPIGSRLYLVEFGDGTSVEIPEAWIDAVDV
jgi:hypothetical protein